MRRLAWTFAARIGDKYQIRLTRSICVINLMLKLLHLYREMSTTLMSKRLAVIDIKNWPQNVQEKVLTLRIRWYEGHPINSENLFIIRVCIKFEFRNITLRWHITKHWKYRSDWWPLLSNRKWLIMLTVKIPGTEWLLGNHPPMDNSTVQNV